MNFSCNVVNCTHFLLAVLTLVVRKTELNVFFFSKHKMFRGRHKMCMKKFV